MRLCAALVLLLAAAPLSARADATVDQLQAAGPLIGSELVPVFQGGGQLRQTTLNGIATFLAGRVTQPNGLKLVPVSFNTVPTCGGGTEGYVYAITDSSTNLLGSVITAGGTNHVLGYCDGTSWKVAAQ